MPKPAEILLERVDARLTELGKTRYWLSMAVTDGKRHGVFTDVERKGFLPSEPRLRRIAEELGTSITPVREAIFRLVSEQALVMSAATSVQVPYLSPDALREIRCIRMELEGLAAAQAALRITNGQIRELEAIQRRFVAAVRTDAKQASLHNREFHFALLRIAAMPKLEVIVENLWTLMGPLLSVFHDTVPVHRIAGKDHPHYDVLAAMRAHDPARARDAIVRDIDWGKLVEAWLLEKDRGETEPVA